MQTMNRQALFEQLLRAIQEDPTDLVNYHAAADLLHEIDQPVMAVYVQHYLQGAKPRDDKLINGYGWYGHQDDWFILYPLKIEGDDLPLRLWMILSGKILHSESKYKWYNNPTLALNDLFHVLSVFYRLNNKDC